MFAKQGQHDFIGVGKVPFILFVNLFDDLVEWFLLLGRGGAASLGLLVNSRRFLKFDSAFKGLLKFIVLEF